VTAEPKKPYLMLWLDEEGKGCCMLDVETFSEPGIWGVVLADVVEHVSNAYSQRGMDRDAVRDAVIQLFTMEVDQPTDTVTGGIVRGEG
jgi:hypothetical protein